MAFQKPSGLPTFYKENKDNIARVVQVYRLETGRLETTVIEDISEHVRVLRDNHPRCRSEPNIKTVTNKEL